jgi:hypothetical protein
VRRPEPRFHWLALDGLAPVAFAIAIAAVLTVLTVLTAC